MSREVRIQAFHYKVLHRTLPCNAFLHQLKIKTSNQCTFCSEKDDILHYLYLCPDTCAFWQSLSLWLTNNSDAVSLPRQLEVTDFLFGIRDNDAKSHRINFIILLGKFYIYKQKLFHGGSLDTYAFLVELKHILTIERMACLQEGAYKKKFAVWEVFYDEL